MKYDQFIEEVQERAGLDERAEAERTVWAVLQALCDRLTYKEGSDLLAQLPAKIKRRVKPTRAVMRLTPDEFVRWVADDLDVEPEEARKRVQAVFAVTREAISEGEFRDVLEQLDPPFADLLA